MNNKKLFIFATSSPRRKQIIKKIYGDRIKFVKHSFDEEKYKINSIESLKILTIKKAYSIKNKFKKAVIISADTAVFCGKKILGKPENVSSAKKMLTYISGKNLVVATGVFILDTETEKSKFFVEKTFVKIKKLLKEEIDWYISTNEPFDKAGAFAIQGKGAVFIERIDGDYFNVVGLPIYKFSKEIRHFGLELF